VIIEMEIYFVLITQMQRRNSGFMKGLQMSQQQEMIDRVREGALREELDHIPTNKAARSYLERVQAHSEFPL
jgi:hypothetical protein